MTSAGRPRPKRAESATISAPKLRSGDQKARRGAPGLAVGPGQRLHAPETARPPAARRRRSPPKDRPPSRPRSRRRPSDRRPHDRPPARGRRRGKCRGICCSPRCEGAGMRAEAFLDPDIKRLLEGADRLPGLEDGGGGGGSGRPGPPGNSPRASHAPGTAACRRRGPGSSRTRSPRRRAVRKRPEGAASAGPHLT